MPPKKLSPRTPQQTPGQKPQGQNATKVQANPTPPAAGTKSSKPTPATSKQAIPEEEVKKSSSVSAQLALEAAKKAYELRQAAYGAGDPNAREEILAKAINKEIEAESFGKAAKYTRSGAFQGLAAGAGLGVQPGVTLGKLTGALVGGLVSSVGAVLGGGIGSAYGAISGPFWDLGQMASQGVRSIVGDFPNWEATSSQKAALEKMVIGAQKTKAPDTEELEQMRDDDGGASQADYQQFTQSLMSWIPNAPSMPSMSSMPSISIPGFGGQSKEGGSTSTANRSATAAKSSQKQQPKGAAATTKTQTHSNPQSTSKSTTSQTTTSQPQASSKPQNGSATKTSSQTTTSKPTQKSDNTQVKKKPKKLEPRSTSNASQPKSTSSVSQPDQPTVRRAPPKLGPRRKPTPAST